MPNLIAMPRRTFFQDIAKQVGKKDGQLIVLTHLLEDRPELLDVMAGIAPISHVLAIDYSFRGSVYEQLVNRYPITKASLADLQDASFLRRQIEHATASKARIVVAEIGGYFAALLGNHSLKTEFGEGIAGFVEETEAGHRKYDALPKPLPYPVMSVARSPLKQAEDALVGPSCIYSVDTILRSFGVLLRTKRAVVLGYGKVGRGTAFALRNMQCEVAVYDVDPIRQTVAIGEGFSVPERHAALKWADIVMGCTGEQSVSRQDFALLRPGALLVSCSSKQVEFDVAGLEQQYDGERFHDDVTLFRPKQGGDRERTVRLVAKGTPVNFLHSAVIGPALALVQAELLVAIGALFDRHSGAAVTIEEVEVRKRAELAKRWLGIFCDPETGSYVQ